MSEGPRRSVRDTKEQFRLERHQSLLVTALGIVTTEGLGALTMQRLADDVGCGIGSLYRHFPSKDALIAELQREALDVVNTSFRLSQAHLTDLVEARSVDPLVAGLAGAYAAARFWIVAEQEFPQEIDLSRRMFTDPVLVMDEAEATRVVPAALRLLAMACGLLDVAVEVGALRDGINVERAVIIIAGSTGVLMTSGLGRWDDGLFDGARLATSMVHDLFVGWGATVEHLQAADDLIAELATAGHLVPPLH